MAEQQTASDRSPGGRQRLYILLAAVFLGLTLIVVLWVVVKGVRERRAAAPTETAPVAPSPRPTFTPAPSPTPLPSPAPTNTPLPRLGSTDSPLYQLWGDALAGPKCDGTVFWGQVVDAAGNPLAGVPVIVWEDGLPAAPVARTDADGRYTISLADEPLASTWTIQLLTDALEPASGLFTFITDEDCQAGTQQFQVNWQHIP